MAAAADTAGVAVAAGMGSSEVFAETAAVGVGVACIVEGHQLARDTAAVAHHSQEAAEGAVAVHSQIPGVGFEG